MSFLQPTAPEVCWSSAWEQDGTIPSKSCYCADLHLLKDLFVVVVFVFLKERKVALSLQSHNNFTSSITLILVR